MNITQNNRNIIALACEVVGTTKLAKIMQEKGADVSSDTINRYKFGQRVRQSELSNLIVRTCIRELRRKQRDIDIALKKAEL